MAGRTNEPEGSSGAALIKFLDEAMQRGLVPPQTGANYIVACRDILPYVLGENWGHADIATLDMAMVMQRLTATKADRQLSRFNEQFLPAIGEFRKHLGLAPLLQQVTVPTDSVPDPQHDPEKNADVWKHRTAPPRPRRVPRPTPPPIPAAPDVFTIPAPRRRTNAGAKRTSSRTGPGRLDLTRSDKSPLAPEETEVPTMTSSSAVPSFAIIPHFFPVRHGLLATLTLPADLTALEARRLTVFIESLALPDAPNGSVTVGADGSTAGPRAREEQVPPQPAMVDS